MSTPPPNQPPQDSYGYQGQPSDPSNGMGTAALVLGVIGLLTSIFVVGALFGVIAVILGFLGRGKAKRGEATNGGVALGGIITGALSILIVGALAIGAVALFNSDTFQNLTECVQAADDQTAVEDCAQQFEGQN